MRCPEDKKKVTDNLYVAERRLQTKPRKSLAYVTPAHVRRMHEASVMPDLESDPTRCDQYEELKQRKMHIAILMARNSERCT